MNPIYLARIKLPPKDPGTHGLLYHADNNIWLHNEEMGWNECQRIPCRESDAVDVITMVWFDPAWELEMLTEEGIVVQVRITEGRMHDEK